jgi:hypothetical protein
MVYEIEEFFLNDEGRNYFPDWVLETLRSAPNYEGYQTMQRIEDIEQPERSLVMKIFDTIGNLRSWNQSAACKELTDKLQPYMTQGSSTTVYQA